MENDVLHPQSSRSPNRSSFLAQYYHFTITTFTGVLALSLFNQLFTHKTVHTCSGVNPGTSSDSRLKPLWFQIRSRSIWHTLSHTGKKQRQLLKEEYHSPRLWLRPRVEADAVNIREIKAILGFTAFDTWIFGSSNLPLNAETQAANFFTWGTAGGHWNPSFCQDFFRPWGISKSV